MNWITKIIKAGEKIKTAFHERASKEDIAKSDWTSCCKGPILKNYTKIKKQNKSKNVVIGFGITEKTIKSLKKADGLVVGSAICNEISKSIKNRQNAVTNVTNVVKKLKNKIQ